ncbi:thiamine-phosphate kinase [Hydromonas duriensis]|uniref:Thiamine-monophosphate kinase n=1 Tax=Hydromonas duriensis TaxID=1527608 RepID=A0A4R6Y960_9BURK|nr:thiamine-phosphate kinase [Hydromonas duriensis]TDR31967.1 thiamine-phosphate kinase [Hydromonas duriensis]
MHEFQIIQSYFTHLSRRADLGVGDDAALFRVSPNCQCVVTSDMLVAGRHFFPDVDARTLGHKALAVNVSDLAAMGAEPLGFTLSLALPSVDEAWLADFSGGLLALATSFNCDLMGGDTTRSGSGAGLGGLDGLVINITAFGQVPAGAAIRRDGARVGDDIWVSGTLGDAALALALLQRQRAGESLPEQDSTTLAQLRSRLEMPTARVELGLALRGVASSMLDVSDGLAGDVRHILRASNVSAEIDCDALPLSSPLALMTFEQPWQRWRLALTGGDDYELCFTAPLSMRARIADLVGELGVPLTRIGRVVPVDSLGAPRVMWQSEISSDSLAHMNDWQGYNHFS